MLKAFLRFCLSTAKSARKTLAIPLLIFLSSASVRSSLGSFSSCSDSDDSTTSTGSSSLSELSELLQGSDQCLLLAYGNGGAGKSSLSIGFFFLLRFFCLDGGLGSPFSTVVGF